MRVEIKGPVINDGDQWIYDYFGIPAVSPGKVLNSIDQAIKNGQKELQVVINSGGGSVFSASEIYTALKSFDGTVNVEIVGVAASAASVIAMAGTNVVMSPTAQMMIHNASNGAHGDYQVMDDNSEFLKNVNASIINSYTAKTGKSSDELKIMMDKTTWMTAQQAKEHGFIDAIMFEKEVGAVADLGINSVIPQEVIDKVRQQMAKDPAVNVVNQANNLINKNKNKDNGGNDVMDLQTLQNEHPELFEQVKNMGYEEGVEAENSRIKEIEDIAVPGNEALVTDAKYKNRIPAAQFAINALKAQKEQAQNQLTNMKKDAAPLNDIPGSAAPVSPDPKDEMDKEAEALGNIFVKGGE
ncbi:head maturation protease, ClpP-related [Lysinibacillus sphaericus]|uniref:ATP-dependent Clp protease proteolytic subunit n=1 Tax=Lysinibacillus sphaericus OT4b.31 TaxID=1285586 RepID=R7Z8H0_LYSSH|nr:head maturation protease, ClpP-related [Lysinibacillus sphaericus]EON70408.1 phage protein [Lysinibacillus sphaericus OT4b.31]